MNQSTYRNIIRRKQRQSESEGIVRSLGLQPVWEAIIKYMASLFELQRKEVKKHKETKIKKKKRAIAKIVICLDMR